jgi:D-alanyl-D-alanine carboxypeptidase
MERRSFLGLMGAGVMSSVVCANETATDIWLKHEHRKVIISVAHKLNLIEGVVGYGNFNLISFDAALKVARNHPNIGAFSAEELSFIEEVFYADPTPYGFYGKRTVEHITDVILEKEVVKIAQTGHFVFKGHSHELLSLIYKDVGSSVILTSGVRSVMKQMRLHLDKIISENGNITVATRSLVPPAYSYHSIGDFDVGKKGFGADNFTANFARTEEFWSLQKLSYISMRYTVGNGDGVRFEPWHIKIV